jgi:DNA processing protein
MLSAALLRVPARRLRGLALGDETALRDWIANESAWRLAETRRDVRLLAERIERAGARVVTLGSASYPVGLRDLRDPPPFLIVRGTLAPEHAGTAIVGTRTPDPAAAAYAYALAELAPGPIVSGLALGIDAAAHRGALAAGTPTIAYVAHGLDAVYPPEHAELEMTILAAGGAVASERLPGERATAAALVRRDRLQAAHAKTVALVQSESDGGAMHTLRFAERIDRPRFALERLGSGSDASSDFSGNAAALAAGASVLAGDPERDARHLADVGAVRRLRLHGPEAYELF